MTRAAEKSGATVKDKKHDQDQDDAVEAKTKTQDHGKAANAKKHDEDQDQAVEAKNQGKAAEAKDQRHEANGQGSVGQGGTDKQGHPLTKDGHVDHRIKSEK